MTDELKPCPGCGHIPKNLCINENGQGMKWAEASCDRCGEWSVEFRTQYFAPSSETCQALAWDAWNAAPRAQYDLYLHAAAEQGKLIKELRGFLEEWKQIAKDCRATIDLMQTEIDDYRRDK